MIEEVDHRLPGDPAAPLCSRAAHDLSQPVQAILLLTRALSQDVDQAELWTGIGHIEAAAESLRGMLELLVLCARSEPGQNIDTARTFPLADALGPLIVEMGERAKARGFALRYRRANLVVRSHPELLVTAVRSFFLLALKYGSAGEIALTCHRHGALCTIALRFRGAPLTTGQRTSAFVHLAPIGDEPAAGFVGAGTALLEHLCRRLGHSLVCKLLPTGEQVLALVLQASTPAVNRSAVCRGRRRGRDWLRRGS